VDAPHDGDADGVVGGEDRCPDAPELVNGVDDGDGCPDVGPFGIRLDERGERIEHDGKIHFGLDGDAIPEEHLPLLAALAEVIQASPGLGVVRVEVHTDPRGSAEYNRLLSQRRAEAIRAALIERGVDGGRLRAIGFGADRPIVCNECDSWALSRRVEFWRDR
ncbi:MAG: OmpA family protein, partial [Myxococcales bacterium]|nr:OmpA family protein [Myxococcales bacterium]